MKSWVYSIAPRCAAQVYQEHPPWAPVYSIAPRSAARRESTTRPKNKPMAGWLMAGWQVPGRQAGTYGWLAGTYGRLAGTYGWLNNAMQSKAEQSTAQ